MLLEALLYGSAMCDLLASTKDYVASCEESPIPIIEVGDIVVSDPMLYLEENYSGQNFAGSIDVKIAPEPTDGFYEIGAFPACIREGSLWNVAGGGGWGQMFPPDHYWTMQSDGVDGFLVGFNDDPCLKPAERVAVVAAGYSDGDPWIPPSAAGWAGGVSCFTTAGGEVCFEVTHPNPTTWNVKAVAKGATWIGDNATVIETKLAAFFGTSGTVMFDAINDAGGRFLQINLNNPLLWGGVSNNGRDTYSFSVTRPAGEGIRFQERENLLGFPEIEYRSVWADEFEPGAMDWKVFVLRSPRFDELLFVEPTSNWATVTGQCDDFECVRTYCAGYGIDLPGLVQCLFAMDVDWGDWFRNVGEQLGDAQLLSYRRYTTDVIFSFPNQVKALDGQCGDLLPDMSGTLLEGLSLNTCDLPHVSMIRGIVSFFVWWGVAVFMWRLSDGIVRSGWPAPPVAVEKGGKS